MELFLKVLFIFNVVSSLRADEVESGNREAKQLIGFRIPAKNCSSFIEGYEEGYCDGIASCISYGGYFGGICNSGLGMCCVVRKSCGENVRTRIAYFRNRGHPGTTNANGECQITIHRYYSDVTQVRLDFVDFDLASPTVIGGQCVDEAFTVASTGSDTRFALPQICGTNEGKHMYVNFANDATATLTLSVKLSGTRESKFNIRITQYRCNHPDKAPDGCLQYYREPTDTVESFNFGANNGNQVLRNQFYDICIDKNVVGDCIGWTFEALDLTVNPSGNIDACVTHGSYVNIPSGQYTDAGVTTQRNVYCDNMAPPTAGTVISSDSYKMQVVVDGDGINDLQGFKATYAASANCPV